MVQLIQHFCLQVTVLQQITKCDYSYRTSEHLANSVNSLKTSHGELALALDLNYLHLPLMLCHHTYTREEASGARFWWKCQIREGKENGHGHTGSVSWTHLRNHHFGDNSAETQYTASLLQFIAQISTCGCFEDWEWTKWNTDTQGTQWWVKNRSLRGPVLLLASLAKS